MANPLDFLLLFFYCSNMRKSRRKADIRAKAAAELGELAQRRAEALAFKQPRPQSWHDMFLKALGSGATIEAAAERAGVTRAGVRYARQHNRRFADAYREAYGCGLMKRFQRRDATNGWTMNQGGLTTNRTQCAL